MRPSRFSPWLYEGGGRRSDACQVVYLGEGVVHQGVGKISLPQPALLGCKTAAVLYHFCFCDIMEEAGQRCFSDVAVAFTIFAGYMNILELHRGFERPDGSRHYPPWAISATLIRRTTSVHVGMIGGWSVSIRGTWAFGFRCHTSFWKTLLALKGPTVLVMKVCIQRTRDRHVDALAI